MSSIHGFDLTCNGTRKRPTSKVVVVTPPTATLPEAACSVNVFFHMAGYGKAQATGRGATAQEATANLTATIDATRAALAPAPVKPAVLSTTQRIVAMLTCGIEKAVRKNDMPLVERLTKAATLVLSGAVQPGNREGLVTVRSMARPEVWYEVEYAKCTCPDWTNHAVLAKYTCKHVLATMMYERLAEPQ